jgi:hypothetical protein
MTLRLKCEKNISKKEHPHRDLSTALRSGRDDKGERSAPREIPIYNMGATVMRNGSCSATTLPGSAALPFVISTGAQRSGEISVWMLFLGNVFLTQKGELFG